MDASLSLILAVIILIAVIGVVSLLLDDSDDFQPEERRVGKEGEEMFKRIIMDIKEADDHTFFNVEIEVEGRRTELDCVVVNKYGVFIFEVKNYSGKIVGDEGDLEWEKYTVSEAGNTYTKIIANPIKQVKREVYLLASLLREFEAKAWVDGFVYFVNKNSPTESEYVVWNSEDISNQIHQSERKLLGVKTIQKICDVLDGIL